MKCLISALTAILLFVSLSMAGPIITPVFPHKDGEASATGFTGSEKDIIVDGGAQQITGWVIFQTAGIDFTGVSSAVLTLYVKALDAPGTLGIHALTAPIINPENNVPLSLISYNPTPAASVYLGTADIENVIQLDITSIFTAGSFYGIALVSQDGLVATFDAKEGNLKPLIMLSHDVSVTADKWHTGSGVPSATLGKDGDLYLDVANGNVYTRALGAWSVAMNISVPAGPQGPAGPAGPTGSQGAQGPPGLKGDKGDQGSFPSGTAPGDMQYWDGSQWVMIPVGSPGQLLNLEANETPTWVNPVPSFISDIDGNIYHTITIGTQTWLVENLKTTRYNDGTAIPLVTDETDWSNLTTPGYCWYDNDIDNQATYGALYNWYTVNTGKLAPTGWHVATDAEWTTLTTYLGGASVAGGKLKEAGLDHWIAPNTGATNETGFSALPGSDRYYNGAFHNNGTNGFWWSSTEDDATDSWSRLMNYINVVVNRYSYDKEYGFSVRCVRD